MVYNRIIIGYFNLLIACCVPVLNKLILELILTMY